MPQSPSWVDTKVYSRRQRSSSDPLGQSVYWVSQEEVRLKIASVARLTQRYDQLRSLSFDSSGQIGMWPGVTSQQHRLARSKLSTLRLTLTAFVRGSVSLPLLALIQRFSQTKKRISSRKGKMAWITMFSNPFFHGVRHCLPYTVNTNKWQLSCHKVSYNTNELCITGLLRPEKKVTTLSWKDQTQCWLLFAKMLVYFWIKYVLWWAQWFSPNQVKRLTLGDSPLDACERPVCGRVSWTSRTRNANSVA